MPDLNFHSYPGESEIAVSNWFPLTPAAGYTTPDYFIGAVAGEFLNIPVGALPDEVGNASIVGALGTSGEIQFAQEGKNIWTRITAPNGFAGDFNAAAFAPISLSNPPFPDAVGRLVVVGDGEEIQITDALTFPVFTQIRTGQPGTLLFIKWLNGQLFAGGDDGVGGPLLLNSQDGGLTWNPITVPIIGTIFSISYGIGSAGPMLVVAGGATPGTAAWYSTDNGATWFQCTTDPAYPAGVFHSTTFYKGRFYLGEVSIAATVLSQVSDDGMSFARQPYSSVADTLIAPPLSSGPDSQYEIFQGLLLINNLTSINYSKDGENFVGNALTNPNINPNGIIFGPRGLAVGKKRCIAAGVTDSQTVGVPIIYSSLAVGG